MQEEAWKPAFGIEGLYEISNLGKIKSILFRKTRILKPLNSRSGHQHITLWKNKKSYRKLVHVLVLEAFVGPCPTGQECRHFPDSNPRNNQLTNLKWGTRKENEADKVIHGTSNRGERNGMSKLTAERVQAIRNTKGRRYKDLANRFKVSRSLISRVKTGKIWKEV